MEVSDIEVGVTYIGPRDYERGLGSHRTPVEIDGNLVLFRVEVGASPPDGYVSHATLALTDFASWAQEPVPAPMLEPSI